MLDLYKEEQKNAYDIMINEIKNHRISHAYLIDENGNNKALDIIKSFVKEILYEDNKEILTEFELNSLYKRIDDNNYPEFRVIEPDGLYIKKGQIKELQQEFSMASIEGSRRIYVIRECEKMRPEAANAMLKFLEEPDNNIIAIMTTNNYDGVLKTIISRCQFIKLAKDTKIIEDNILELDIAIDFIYDLENNGLNTILNLKELWNDKVKNKDREKITIIIDKMIDIYYNILKIKKGIKLNDVNYMDKLEIICELNTSDMIIKKINYLLEIKEIIKYNINCNLLVDAIVVNIGGMKDESSWN